MGTYAVGDIHGCYTEWIQLKNKIESQDKDARFIFVGDIVDRGTEVIDMVRWAMNNITPNGKYQMVIGNHELEKIAWIEDYLKEKDIADQDNKNFTLKDMYNDRYNFLESLQNANVSDEELVKMYRLFKKLPYIKDINVNNQRFIIVHANLPYSAINKEDKTIKNKLSESCKEFIVWDRTVYDFNKLPNTILIHGHTPTLLADAFELCDWNSEAEGKIYKLHNNINIDCGIAYKSLTDKAQLAAIRLDDLKEFYIKGNYEDNTI